MRRVLRAALGAGALLGACQSTAPGSCGDDLSGIWRSDDGRRFHLVDRRETVEIYPLFDPVGDKASRPWRTPAKTEMERRGGLLLGRSTFQAQGERLCTVTTPARLEACAATGARLVIDLEPRLDRGGCAALPRDVAPMTIRRL